MTDFMIGITLIGIGLIPLLIIGTNKNSNINLWCEGKFIIYTSIFFASISNILFGIFMAFYSINGLLFSLLFAGISISFILGGFINLNREKVFHHQLGFIGVISGIMSAILIFVPIHIQIENLRNGIFTGHAFLSFTFYTLFLLGLIHIFYIIDVYLFSYKIYWKVMILFSLYALCVFVFPSIIFINLYFIPNFSLVIIGHFLYSFGWIFLALLAVDKHIFHIFLPFNEIYFAQANISGGITLFTISYKKTDLDFDFTSALVSSLNNALEMILPHSEWIIYTIQLVNKIILVSYNTNSQLYFVVVAKSYPATLYVSALNLLMNEKKIQADLTNIYELSEKAISELVDIILDSFGKRTGFEIVGSFMNM